MSRAANAITRARSWLSVASIGAASQPFKRIPLIAPFAYLLVYREPATAFRIDTRPIVARRKRWRLPVLIVCVATLIATGTATAETTRLTRPATDTLRQGTVLQLPDGTTRPQPWQRWADRALVPMAVANVQLTVGRCGRFLACAAGARVWVDPTDTWDGPRWTLLHELGHVFDTYAMTDAARVRFMAIFHEPGPWDIPLDAPYDPNRSDTPASERFAEGYALCARRRSIREPAYRGEGYIPTPRQHRQVCKLIASVAP